MNDHSNIIFKARNTESLEKRIAENVASQELDLSKWIFDGIKVNVGARVLELCCGTGAQTLSFVKLIGDNGCVVAIDVSREALVKLSSKVDAKQLSRLTLIETDVDRLGEALIKQGISRPYFDIIFCAYGLYYSTDVELILRLLKEYLISKGVIIIVGPFGPNNIQLYDLLRSSGVNIPDFVSFSSGRFMYDKVIPWASTNFKKVSIRTAINKVKWNSPDQILTYWENSTFYVSEKRNIVKKSIDDYFKGNQYFVNEKWIMMVKMSNAR